MSKLKILLNRPFLLLSLLKANSLFKKSKTDPERFNIQRRNDFLLKKIEKLFKTYDVHVEVEGYENLGKGGPAILVGNHQDNIDSLVLIYALKKQTEERAVQNKVATFIAKHELQYNFFTRYPLQAMDTFFLDRKDIKKSLETYNEFGKYIKTNKTYGVIFPEGTRNKEGKIGEFKPGAFKVAKKEFIPIIPFTINNSVQGLNSNRKKTLNIKVIFHGKINPNSFITQDTFAIANRVYEIVNSSFIKPELNFIESKNDQDIENSKKAIKWNKKEEKKKVKLIKKEYKLKKQEDKLIELEKKEEEKYEKLLAKRENKKNKKEQKNK